MRGFGERKLGVGVMEGLYIYVFYFCGLCDLELCGVFRLFV